MATRGIIAEPHGDSWWGVYHHWDSYPGGLGRELWHLYQDRYHGDIGAMRTELVHAHRGGWSTIVGANWEHEPGFVEYGNAAAPPDRPQCYCHGDRHEGPFPLRVSGGDNGDIEYIYVLCENGMAVLAPEPRPDVEDRTFDSQVAFVPWHVSTEEAEETLS